MWPKLSSIILQWAGSLVKRHHNKTNLVLCHTDTIFWLFLIRWLAKRVSFHRDKSIIFYCSQFNCLSEWLKEIHGLRWCRPLPLLLQIIFCTLSLWIRPECMSREKTKQESHVHLQGFRQSYVNRTWFITQNQLHSACTLQKKGTWRQMVNCFFFFNSFLLP